MPTPSFHAAARTNVRLAVRSCLLLLVACGLTAAQAIADDASSTVSLATNGAVLILRDGQRLCTMTPTAADKKWKFFSAEKADGGSSSESAHFALGIGEGISGAASLSDEDGVAKAEWEFKADGQIAFNLLCVNLELPIEAVAGGTWTAGEKSGTFPDKLDTPHLFGGEVKTLKIAGPKGEWFTLTFPQATRVNIQDNRKWGGKSFSVRIGWLMSEMVKGEIFRLPMSISTPGKLTSAIEKEVTIAAGDDWIPLEPEVGIVPGSALDLSVNGLTDGPCGSKGRVIATPEGHFAFASTPDEPQRFYGANLNFTAQYMSQERVDALLDRWVMMGYNTLRIHHYEFRLTEPHWQAGFDWDPKRLDQLCYLIAGSSQRGIWLTLDLFVSRPIAPSQIDLPAEAPYINSQKRIDFQTYKALVLVHEPAYQDFVKFTDQLLSHVNPYTGNRLAEEPALAWLSMLNEGAPGNRVRDLPEWKTAWNDWLADRYPERDALAAALGDLGPDETPANGTVDWPADDVLSDTPRGRVCQVFLAAKERDFVRRIKAHLRDKLNCPALITNHNTTPYTVADMAVAEEYDYVDTHFYVDHPIWTSQRWRLPSHSPNRNPARSGVPGGTERAPLRQYGKPFTVSEFNYSGPGQYRGIGAMMTGALAAHQDWDVLWRFAYAHNDTAIFEPLAMDFFNMSRDPLALAADRAAVMLFLRGDLSAARRRFAAVISDEQLTNPPASPSLLASRDLAWVSQIGYALGDAPDGVTSLPLGSSAREFINAARSVGVSIKPDDSVIRSETGEIMIDRAAGVICVDTPRTAGGYAEVGRRIKAAKAGVQVDRLDYGATVFVTSLDRQPIQQASRLLVTHLTDLQNTGAKFAESSRQTLVDWGKLPYLVRDGSARVRIELDQPGDYQVWSLSTSGRRLELVPAESDGSSLVFEVNVDGPSGARMLYEVANATVPAP